MSDSPAKLRQKAEACRLLADSSENAERKDLWLKRADEWDQLAKKAEEQLRAKGRPGL